MKKNSVVDRRKPKSRGEIIQDRFNSVMNRLKRAKHDRLAMVELESHLGLENRVIGKEGRFRVGITHQGSFDFDLFVLTLREGHVVFGEYYAISGPYFPTERLTEPSTQLGEEELQIVEDVFGRFFPKQ